MTEPAGPGPVVRSEPPSPAPSGDDGGHDARVLLRNADGTVQLEGDLVLIAECDGLHLEHIVSRVTTFAFAVSAIVGTLAATRIAPRPVGLFALAWIAAAITARIWVIRRRREHGRITVDFAAGVVRGATRASAVEWPLDGQVVAELDDPDEPSDHARWLTLRRSGARLRLAHAPPVELRPILYVLRRQGIVAPTV